MFQQKIFLVLNKYMQKENIKNEIIISISFIILLVLFLNPFGFWMPTNVMYFMVAGLVTVFAIFVSFVWKERTHDEREELHKHMAGRIGYTAGIFTLVLAIAIESITSHPDPWLVLVLGAMVIGKIAGQLYGYIRH